MTRDVANTDQARRDVSAARAELRGRRDQVVAEYDDRINLLENLGASLDSGDLTAKVVQDRVRQLLGDRSPMGRGARAGRTSIGMQVPRTAAAAPTVAVRSAPTPGQVTAGLDRTRSVVDQRIVHIMLGSNSAEERLELALLRGLRRALEHQAASIPEDVVLIDSVVEYTHQARSIVQDLEEGGPNRLRRLLEYERELTSQVVALGGSVATVKEQLKRAGSLLAADNPNLENVMKEALAAFTHLQLQLQRRLPGEHESFLDELVAGPSPS